MKSLYVHFPFCEAKCHYCDFYSLARGPRFAEHVARFEAALMREITQQGGRLDSQLDTIYFGGGTPSVFPVETLGRVVDRLGLRGRLHSRTEWTMEVNPGSVSSENLARYRAMGVNRISMGIQSLDASLLKKMGRVHSPEVALRALESLFAAGFSKVSVDLLCGVPGQTLAQLEASLRALFAFPISHLSCYLLTLHDEHWLARELPGEETQLEHLLFVDEWVRARGFRHYEISNYCQPGAESRHNLNYWKGGSYLALGPSAHSFDATTASRWKNISDVEAYESTLEGGGSAVEWSETLTEEQRALEKWLLAVRLDEGFPEDWLDTPSRRQSATALQREGLLERHPDQPERLRLTARGLALSDQVLRVLGC